MRIEELKKIKSFGSDIKSAITSEDIAVKEAELGFALPQAPRKPPQERLEALFDI